MNPGKYWKFQDNLLKALGMALFFALPFSLKFSNIVLVGIALLTIIAKVRQRNIPKVSVHWFLPSLFVYYTISELSSGGSWSDLEKRLILLIPFLFALNPDFYKPHFKVKIYSTYILGNLLAVLICAIRATTRSFSTDNGLWVFNPKVIKDTDYDFLTSSVMGGNYYFGSEFSYFIHPTYFGLYIVFAQYLIFELSKTKKRFYWAILSYFVLLVTLFLLSSKAAIIISLLLTFYILLAVRIPVTGKLTTVAAFVIVIALFVFFNPRLKVFNETFQISRVIDPNARYGHALRILSWDASLDVIRDNWIFGVGEGRKEKALVDAYNKKGYVFPASEKFNSHNQYLDFLLGGGLLCLGLFVAGVIDLLLRSLREPDYPLLMLLLIFSFIAIFENLLSRSHGILFLSVFIGIIVTGRNVHKEELGT